MIRLCLAAASLATTAMAAATPDAPFRPDFSNAAMHVSMKEVHPRQVLKAGNGALLAEGLLITACDDSLVAFRLRDGKEAWRTRTPGGLYPEIVAHHSGVGFVRLWCKQAQHGYNDYAPDPSAEVHRVSLDDGRWHSPLSAGSSLLTKSIQILDVLASSNGVFIMDCIPGESDLHERQIKSYRISGFRGDSSTPRWRKEFKSVGTVPSFGAGLLFQGDRLYAKSKIRHLSLIGGTLIVCAGGVEDILALESASGAEKWRLPAVWEYRRGFIGPSVWQHFVGRFGIDQLPEEKDIRDDNFLKEVRKTRKRMEEKRKDFAARCRIVGGPIALLVPKALQSSYYLCSNCRKYHGKSPAEQYRLFVAVSEGEGDFAGYLSDCIIYEISDEGRPIALVRMPRMVQGSQCFAVDGAALWRCEHGALAELRPSRQSAGIGMGGHGTDCIANLARFVQPSDTADAGDADDNTTTNWLTWANAGDPACLSRDAIYQLSTGPYIRTHDEGIVHFPLVRVSLDGTSSDLILSIPFTGAVHTPSSNYRRSGDSTFAYCPLYLSILDVQSHQGQLAITVSVEGGDRQLLLFQESEIREACEPRGYP